MGFEEERLLKRSLDDFAALHYQGRLLSCLHSSKAFFTKFDISFQIFSFAEIICSLPCLYLDFEQLHFSIFIFIFDAATFDIFHYKFLWFSFPFAVSENTVIDIQAPGSPVVYGYVHIYLIHILDTISNHDDYVFLTD